MDIEILKGAGLTNGEAKVYLALLGLGSLTTGPIVEKSGVARSIVYQLLEKLIQKGLVSYIIKEKTKYFQASDPDKILDYIEERKKNLEKSKQKIESILPQLLAKQNFFSKESDVKVFEGFKGMIAVHEHIYKNLKKGESYFFFGIPQEQPKHFHAYWKRDHVRRVKAGILCKLLFNPKTPKEILLDRSKYKGCDARYMPIEVNTPAWFMGYKDTAVIGFASSSPITIEIKNTEIADSFRAYFEEFWKIAKPFRNRN
ncbi:MAG: hypothetical protein HY513_03805 [Candidatus Aenigmarchaeota archaeon]|nr:hypothetical protein [Candidatus Aenigmarchaeota archaeon]